MTRTDGMEQFDRLAHAGYRAPEDVAAAFDEWMRHFGDMALEDVDAGLTRLMRGRASSFWPTPGELAEHIRAVQSGRDRRSASCPTCDGTTWVESVPFRANGGLLYAGVVRCHACGIPAPRLDALRGHQTPLGPHEARDMARKAASDPAIAAPATRGEFLAAVAAMAARKGWA